MNREQTIEAIKVMQAWVDGKQLEFRTASTAWQEVKHPVWDFECYYYRIKSTAALRPWTADEVPLGAMIRFKQKPHDRSLLSWVSVPADRELWLQEREHSTDGGDTWKPCGVEITQ